MDGSGDGFAKGFLVLRFVWFAVVISVVIFVVVAYLGVAFSAFRATAAVDLLFPAMMALSAALLAVQGYIRSFLRDGRLFPGIRNRMPADPTGAGASPGQHALLLFQDHFRFSVITWAIGDAIGMFGFVLTVLSGDVRYVAGFGLFSVLDLLAFRPSRARFDDQLGRLKRYLAGLRVEG